MTISVDTLSTHRSQAERSRPLERHPPRSLPAAITPSERPRTPSNPGPGNPPPRPPAPRPGCRARAGRSAPRPRRALAGRPAPPTAGPTPPPGGLRGADRQLVSVPVVAFDPHPGQVLAVPVAGHQDITERTQPGGQHRIVGGDPLPRVRQRGRCQRIPEDRRKGLPGGVTDHRRRAGEQGVERLPGQFAYGCQPVRRHRQHQATRCADPDRRAYLPVPGRPDPPLRAHHLQRLPGGPLPQPAHQMVEEACVEQGALPNASGSLAGDNRQRTPKRAAPVVHSYSRSGPAPGTVGGAECERPTITMRVYDRRCPRPPPGGRIRPPGRDGAAYPARYRPGRALPARIRRAGRFLPGAQRRRPARRGWSEHRRGGPVPARHRGRADRRPLPRTGPGTDRHHRRHRPHPRRLPVRGTGGRHRHRHPARHPRQRPSR